MQRRQPNNIVTKKKICNPQLSSEDGSVLCFLAVLYANDGPNEFDMLATFKHIHLRGDIMSTPEVD